MAEAARGTVLCLASYEKGEPFMRASAAHGWNVLLLSVVGLEHIAWPRESLADTFFMPELADIPAVINAVSYLARSHHIDKVMALDEYDVMIAAALREHLQISGMGESATRLLRDKLAMRVRAEQRGVPVPHFTSAINDADVSSFLDSVPPPWVLKPRAEASTIGIEKLSNSEEVWRYLDGLGDRRSSYLIERYVAGNVYHADSLVAGGKVAFASVSRYGRPPLDVFHQGGVSYTVMIERGSDDEVALQELNARVLKALEVTDCATHMEFIKGEDGVFYFLEVAARVGGAYISNAIEAATGVNLWVEWARLECPPNDTRYRAPRVNQNYAGVIISLAKQEHPDTSSYTDPEIVWRLDKPSHVGMIVSSPDASRTEQLLGDYARRFTDDFLASLPPWTERPPAES